MLGQLEFLIENLFVICADLFLYSYEAGFMQGLPKKKKK
jgi:hypothetical protein